MSSEFRITIEEPTTMLDISGLLPYLGVDDDLVDYSDRCTYSEDPESEGSLFPPAAD